MKILECNWINVEHYYYSTRERDYMILLVWHLSIVERSSKEINIFSLSLWHSHTVCSIRVMCVPNCIIHSTIINIFFLLLQIWVVNKKSFIFDNTKKKISFSEWLAPLESEILSLPPNNCDTFFFYLVLSVRTCAILSTQTLAQLYFI